MELSTKKRFIHGNLDHRSVFIDATSCEAEEEALPRLQVDFSEHHMLTRMLKPVAAAEIETQEETTSED